VWSGSDGGAGCDAGPYVLPGVNPVTVTEPVRADFDLVTPPLLDVHVAAYFVIGEPSFLGAPNAIRDTPLATRKTCATVAEAGVPAVTGLDVTDGGPSTNPFSAVTVNVYVNPFTRPLTTVVVPYPGMKTDNWATVPKDGATTYPPRQFAPVNGGAPRKPNERLGLGS
jgi:hypothetical protein